MPSRDTTIVRRCLFFTQLYSLLLSLLQEGIRREIVISKCERDRHIEDPATEELALVICEMLWRAGARERKHLAPGSEKGFRDFKKRFEKQTTGALLI